MTSLNLGPSPRPPEGGLRPVLRLTAGQVLFVMALGLLLGALLNADLLMKAAERRAFDDPHRDLHVAVWRVAQNVSHALFLDEPRNLIDGLTANRPPPPPVDGPRGTAGAAPGDVEGGFGPVPPPGPAPDAPPPPGPGAAGVVAGPDAPPPPGPGAAEIVAGPDVRVPTTDDPLRVWIGGDSMIGSAGLAFRRIAAASGVMASDEVDVRVSTGLARPDFFDWPAHLEEQVLAKDPEIVILMFGANDAQSLRRPDGSYCRRFEQCWLDTYRGRVADTMDLLREPGGKRLVVWVGQPIMSSSSGVHGIDKMNHLFWDEARKRHWVAYVDAWAWFVDAAGAYARHLPAEDGTESRMRAQDGVHLTMAGGRPSRLGGHGADSRLGRPLPRDVPPAGGVGGAGLDHPASGSARGRGRAAGLGEADCGHSFRKEQYGPSPDNEELAEFRHLQAGNGPTAVGRPGRLRVPRTRKE